MYLDAALFVLLFREIRLVQQALNSYCLEADKIPVSLDDLKDAVRQVYEVEIKQFILPLRSKLIRGVIEMYEGRSVIYVDANLPMAWTRYVVVKEMSHHLVNESEYWTTDPAAIIQYIVQDGVGDKVESAPKDVSTEDLTKFAAIELLFPHSLRRAARDRIVRGDDTLYTTAE